MFGKLSILSLALFLILTVCVSICNALYLESYGKEIPELQRNTEKITILYFDQADGYTKHTQEETALERIEQLVKAFDESWRSVCDVVLVTQSASRIPVSIKNHLFGNQDIHVNKSDELWIKYHRGGKIPAAMIDFNPKLYISFRPLADEHDPTGLKAFKQIFIPKSNSEMSEKLKEAIKQRIAETLQKGDDALEGGNLQQGYESYGEAQRWMNRLTNPIEDFRKEEIAEQYLELVEKYVHAIRSEDSPFLDSNRIFTEKQYMEKALECLEKVMEYVSCEYTELLCAGLNHEIQGRLDDARNAYQRVPIEGRSEIIKRIIGISLDRIERKIHRALLYTSQTITLADGLLQSEVGASTEYFQQAMCERLMENGYRILLKQASGGIMTIEDLGSEAAMVGHIFYSKADLTIRKYRPVDFGRLVVEGDIHIRALYITDKGALEILAADTWNADECGVGKTGIEALSNFFRENRRLFKDKLSAFLGELSETEK